MNARITTKEVPAELIHAEGRQRGSLNQALLQVEGITPTCGMEHPTYGERVVFVQMNHARGTQVWTTKARNEWRRLRNAKQTLGGYHRKRKAAKKVSK